MSTGQSRETREREAAGRMFLCLWLLMPCQLEGGLELKTQSIRLDILHRFNHKIKGDKGGRGDHSQGFQPEALFSSLGPGGQM